MEAVRYMNLMEYNLTLPAEVSGMLGALLDSPILRGRTMRAINKTHACRTEIGFTLMLLRYRRRIRRLWQLLGE